MIQAHDTTLVFTNSRYRTERLTLQLQDAGGDALKVGSHHGSMSRQIRLDMEDRLKAGSRTEMILEEIRFRIPEPEGIFDKRNLRREVRF